MLTSGSSHRPAVGRGTQAASPAVRLEHVAGLHNDGDKLTSAETLEDPTAAIVHVIENPEDSIYVFLDLHRHYSPVTTRLIRDAARAVRTTRKSVLFLSPFYQVPEELQKEVALSIFQLPDRQQLEQVLDGVRQAFQPDAPCGRDQSRLGLRPDPVGTESQPTKMRDVSLERLTYSDLTEEDRAALLRAASGLTANEAELAFRSAMVQTGGLAAAAVRKVAESKTQVIRKSGILDYYDKPESFADVGGLENLTAWFKARAPAFANTARYAGLPGVRWRAVSAA